MNLPDKIELQITPNGQIRTIYHDETFKYWDPILGQSTVTRASNVEFENGYWTVRAFLDPNRAIRIGPFGGLFVSQNNARPIAMFQSRTQALSEEIKHFWKLVE